MARSRRAVLLAPPFHDRSHLIAGGVGTVIDGLARPQPGYFPFQPENRLLESFQVVHGQHHDDRPAIARDRVVLVRGGYVVDNCGQLVFGFSKRENHHGHSIGYFPGQRLRLSSREGADAVMARPTISLCTAACRAPACTRARQSAASRSAARLAVCSRASAEGWISGLGGCKIAPSAGPGQGGNAGPSSP